MSDRKPFLMFARRFHNLFRGAIENGDGREASVWLEERPTFEHYASGMYLSGCLAYLEPDQSVPDQNLDPLRLTAHR